MCRPCSESLAMKDPAPVPELPVYVEYDIAAAKEIDRDNGFSMQPKRILNV